MLLIDDWLSMLVVLLLIFLCHWYICRPKNLPPGPKGVPVFGSIFDIFKDHPERTLAKLSKIYGDVMSLYIGSRLVIVLGNYEATKEAYVKQADIFSGRPDGNAFRILQDDGGLAIRDGDLWKTHRRFTLSTLKDFGFGKNSLEPEIMREVVCLLEVLASNNGQPFDPSDAIGQSVGNVIVALAFGCRFDYKDPYFIKLHSMRLDTVKRVSTVGLRSYFPWMEYIPGFEYLTHFKTLKKLAHEFRKFLSSKIEEHEEKLEDDSSFNNYIDAYLAERNRIIKKTGNEGMFSKGELRDTLRTLFFAGSETTATTILWGLLFMMKHPEIQRKVQKEIDDVIGMDRKPSMNDLIKMPYTEAVILEIHRQGSVIPLNIVHSTMEDTTLLGYNIPKRSYIISNLWFIHHDPENWDEPDQFKPERFLNKEGQVEKPDYLIPFSVGKRACIGESLARMEVFLFFTSLLQRFTFLAPNEEAIRGDFVSGVTRFPKSFPVIAEQRKEYTVIY